MTNCIIENCPRYLHARLMCSMHYQRWKKNNKQLLKPKDMHGMSGTDIHKTWEDIIRRTCLINSVSYKKYTKKYGNPVYIYPPWKSFSAFYKYVGDKPRGKYSIDRIDNSKGYEPGNLRWANVRVQAINKTVAVNSSTGVTGVGYRNGKYFVKITIDGKQKSFGRYLELNEAKQKREQLFLEYYQPIINSGVIGIVASD